MNIIVGFSFSVIVAVLEGLTAEKTCSCNYSPITNGCLLTETTTGTPGPPMLNTESIAEVDTVTPVSTHCTYWCESSTKGKYDCCDDKHLPGAVSQINQTMVSNLSTLKNKTENRLDIDAAAPVSTRCTYWCKKETGAHYCCDDVHFPGVGSQINQTQKNVSPNDVDVAAPVSTRCTNLCETKKKEFYAAARDGDMGYITTELAAQGNSSSSNSLFTWHNEENHYRTALHVAAYEGNDQVVLALLEAGASPNVKAWLGDTPVHYAAARGHTAALRALLHPQYQAHVNQQDDDGHTPVSLAAGNGHTGAVKILIANGADIQMVNNRGRSPLIQASLYGRVDAVKALIEAGASLGDADDLELTALHWAAKYNKSDVARLLVHNGADTSRRDKEGRTPADEARQSGYTELAALIDNWQ